MAIGLGSNSFHMVVARGLACLSRFRQVLDTLIDMVRVARTNALRAAKNTSMISDEAPVLYRTILLLKIIKN